MSLILAILICALQVGDWWTTRTALAQGGRELNPVMAWLMCLIGVDAALIVMKALVGGYAIYLALAFDGLFAVLALVMIAAVYAMIVAHNMGQID